MYLTGRTESFGAGGADMVLVKYDGNGTQQGGHTWGGIDRDFATEVTVNSLDNVYLVGGTGSFGAGSYDMVLVKYSYTERPSSDGFIMIILIVLIASVVGVSNVIIYFIRKQRKIVK